MQLIPKPTRASLFSDWFRAYAAPLALTMLALLCLWLPFFAALTLSITLLSAAFAWAWTSFSFRRKHRIIWKKQTRLPKGQLARVIPFPKDRLGMEAPSED